MSTLTVPAPLRAPRSARWSAVLGVGGIGVQLLGLTLLALARGQTRYGVAVTVVTAGVLAGLGALFCGGWWLRRLRRRARVLRAQRPSRPTEIRAARRSERRLVWTGMLAGLLSAGWWIPVFALGLGWVLVGS
jgi:hypothetical protein